MPIYGQNLQELTVRALEELSLNTNITRMGPGSKARALLDSVNKRIEEAYDIFDVNLARGFVSSAPGQYLDLIGDLLALPRLSSIAAFVESDVQVVKFYVDTGSTFGDINGGADITLFRGTIVSTETENGGITFRLAADLTASSASNAAWASVEATIPGEASNVGSYALVYHDFVGYTDYLNNTLKVANIHPIANGRETESDTNYRYRLSRRVLDAEAANETAVRLAVLSAAGVADVSLIKYYRGIGTFATLIKATTPTVSQTLIDLVTEKVLRVQGLGTLAYVMGPKEVGFTIKLNVYYKSRLSEEELLTIENGMEELIISTVNELDIGETLYINRLIASLFTVSDTIANIGETNKTFEEAYIYKPTRLDDNKIRQRLLGDYTPASDERIIIEPSVSLPVVFTRNYV